MPGNVNDGHDGIGAHTRHQGALGQLLEARYGTPPQLAVANGNPARATTWPLPDPRRPHAELDL